MSLTQALNAARSGLGASSLRAEIAANNVANVNTPGYVARRVQTAPGQIGVDIVGVNRQTDAAISSARRDADSQSARSDVTTTALQQIELRMGEPGDSYGLFARVEDFQSKLETARATPESEPGLIAAVDSAHALASEVRGLSDLIGGIRQQADQSIGTDIETANRILHGISGLNGDIVSAQSAGADIADMQDRRDRLLDTLSGILPIQVKDEGAGRLRIMSEEGITLVRAKVYEIEFEPSGTIPPGYRPGDSPALLSEPSIGGRALKLSSGSLSGHLAVRDEQALNLSDQLDQFSGAMIAAFENPALDATRAAGLPGPFTDGGAAYDPANQRGVAGRFSLNTTLHNAPHKLRDGLGAGAEGPLGNDVILNGWVGAITDFATQAADIASAVGTESLRQDTIHSGNISRQTALQEAELSRTGVDMDFELQSLLSIEQSYQANARVIQTVSEMLDTILRI